ncbi:Uncharacterised protein [Segatella copri]|nr:Uncharacterised protein [Segatella copri]
MARGMVPLGRRLFALVSSIEYIHCTFASLVIFGPNTLRRDAIKLLSAVLQSE